MSRPAAKSQGGAVEVREGRGALPDLQPWREVGWIFRDGETIAIERHDDRTRARAVDDSQVA